MTTATRPIIGDPADSFTAGAKTDCPKGSRRGGQITAETMAWIRERRPCLTKVQTEAVMDYVAELEHALATNRAGREADRLDAWATIRRLQDERTRLLDLVTLLDQATRAMNRPAMDRIREVRELFAAARPELQTLRGAA